MMEIANNVVIPVVVGITIGVALLLLEYRTHWFANWRNRSNETTPPGINVRNVLSRRGSINVKDSTGQGIDADRLTAHKDIDIKNEFQGNRGSVLSDELANAASQFLNSMGMTAEKMFAGGNITVQQFLTNQFPLAQQIEFFSHQIGLPFSHQVNYANSQYAAYCNIWKVLQSLRLAGEDLWQEANTENLVRFATELRKTKLNVNENELFFEEKDRKELLTLLQLFGNYELGKVKLVEIRSSTDEQFLFSQQKIQKQIEMNKRDKEKYENLLERIRLSFRKRLTSPQD